MGVWAMGCNSCAHISSIVDANKTQLRLSARHAECTRGPKRSSNEKIGGWVQSGWHGKGGYGSESNARLKLKRQQQQQQKEQHIVAVDEECLLQVSPGEWPGFYRAKPARIIMQIAGTTRSAHNFTA